MPHQSSIRRFLPAGFLCDSDVEIVTDVSVQQGAFLPTDMPHPDYGCLVLSDVSASRASVQLFQLESHDRWESPARLVREAAANRVIELVPDVWQIREPLLEALQEEAVAIVHIKSWQLQALPRICAELAPQGIVVAAEFLGAVQEVVAREVLSDTFFWLVVGGLDIVIDSALLRPRMCIEMHGPAALPMLIQCSVLAGSLRWHPNMTYVWELEGTELRMTDILQPVRFVRVPLPGRFVAHEVGCECGNPLSVTLI